jgi:tripeptide aminopeptidase
VVIEDRLLDRFVRLCEIPSPTGDERAVADAVLAELRALGVAVEEDSAAGPARAGAGNLVARVAGSSDAWVSFFAHLDTVPHDEPVRVERVNGVFGSAGETILGADNKAAVTVLVELAARAAESGPPPAGLELVFTVAEEDGLRGAKELDVSALRSPYGFVLDHATPIGEIVTAAPTYNRVIAEFEGIEAHAGIRPEDGRSAIAAAGHAVSAMRVGRLDDETTANVGVIAGGTASNVVAGECRLEAEARSLDEGKAAAATAAIVDACTWGASETGCDVDIDVIEMFRGYRVASRARPVRLARAAIERVGIEPRETATGGGSDANALLAQGFEAVLLANGTEANHTHAERVDGARIGEMLQVCLAIADLAAAEEAPA